MNGTTTELVELGTGLPNVVTAPEPEVVEHQPPVPACERPAQQAAGAGSRPLTIAMIGQKGIPAHSGGVERHVEHVAAELVKLGHRVLVYCRPSYLKAAPGRPACGGSASAVKADHRASPLTLLRWSVPTKHLDAITHAAVCCVDAIFRGVDLIHFHAIGPAALAPLARLASVPVVVTVHGLDWQRAKWGLAARWCLRLGELAAARCAGRLVVVSKPLRRYFRQRYGVRAVYIPNGVVPVQRRAPGRILSLGIRPGRFVLAATRLVPEKGLHYLIEAFRRLTAPYQLVVAGAGLLEDGYEQRLRRMAGPNVIFTGNAGRGLLAELYSHAALFVLPSELEGMSVALLEAMSSGLPVLVSDIEENIAVVGSEGFTFRCGDVADLAAKLEFLLAHPLLLAEAGRRLREASESFRWPQVAAQLQRLYFELLAELRQR